LRVKYESTSSSESLYDRKSEKKSEKRAEVEESKTLLVYFNKKEINEFHRKQNFD